MDPQQGPPPQDVLIGQTVGNYLVKQRVGEGGMGAVYLAEHPTIGKKVALKVLHAEFATNPEVVDRFFQEARAVNSIGHPNIVDIVDYGVIQTGAKGSDQLVYFIMEYLAGQTLAQTIRGDSPLPPERALTIALQVADALAASHRAGIVHRDLKPENIILVQRGRDVDFVKLLDFGIAKLTTEGRSGNRTRTGLILGTPAYMSPEQCEGSAKVDLRTDIYALGICLYEMLVGRVPFIGEGYGEILVQHITQKPIEPSRYRMMSPHIEQVVLKALEKRPDLRYPTMDEFIRAMADPVGYVEVHGGVQGFLHRALMPSTAPVPPARLTPSPFTPFPVTGHYTPAPGTLNGPVTSPAPTTLSAATGQGMAPPRSTAGFVIAGVLVVGAAIAGVAVLLTSKKPAPVASARGAAVGSDVTMLHVGAPDRADSAVTPITPVTPVTPVTGSTAPVMASLTLTTNPEGAEILVDGKSTGTQTPATIQLARTRVAVIGFRLKGYEDLVLKELQVDSDKLSRAATLKRLPAASTSTHTHPTTKLTPKSCDTCLERPD